MTDSPSLNDDIVLASPTAEIAVPVWVTPDFERIDIVAGTLAAGPTFSDGGAFS